MSEAKKSKNHEQPVIWSPLTETEEVATIPVHNKGLWNMINDVGLRLGDQHIYLLAAGISFNVLLCLIPLLLVSIFVAGQIVPMHSIVANVQQTLRDTLPETESTHNLVSTIIEEIRIIKDTSSTVGFIGIAILLWSSSALFSSLRTGLNAIFSVETPKFFLIYKLKDLAFTIIIAFLFLLSTMITPFISLMNSELVSYSSAFSTWGITEFFAFMLSAFTAFAFFYILLRFVPNKPQPLFIIFWASLISVVMWEVARFGFTYYLNNVGSFGKFYGTFSVLVASAIWIYYSTLIMLIAAESSEYLYELKMLKKKK